MANLPGVAPAANVIPFHDNREVLRALQDAAEEINIWHELYPKEKGIVGGLLAAHHELLSAILSGRNKKEIASLVDALVVMHSDFQDAFAPLRLSNVTLNDLKRVIGEIADHQNELAGLNAKLSEAQSRNAGEVEGLLAQFRGATEAYRRALASAAVQMNFVDSLANQLREFCNDVVGRAEEGNRLIETCTTGIVSFQLPKQGVAADKIFSEISRREAWLSEANNQQEKIEAGIDETRAVIAGLEQEIQFGSSRNEAREKKARLEAGIACDSAFVEQLLALRRPVEEGLNALTRHLRMVELVNAGVREDLFSETLPDMPVRPEGSVEIAEEPSLATQSGFDKERRGILACIARDNALSEALVFLFSLYEILPKRGEGTSMRGVSSILTTAKSCGFFDLFGWESHREILDDCTRENAPAIARFLMYQGTPSGGSSVYRRNGEVLPWNVRELFVSKEIVRFHDEVAAKR